LGKRKPELAPESAMFSVYFHAGAGRRREELTPYEQNNPLSDISQIAMAELSTESSAGYPQRYSPLQGKKFTFSENRYIMWIFVHRGTF
jgi:hypothetical protein